MAAGQHVSTPPGFARRLVSTSVVQASYRIRLYGLAFWLRTHAQPFSCVIPLARESTDSEEVGSCLMASLFTRIRYQVSYQTRLGRTSSGLRAHTEAVANVIPAKAGIQ